MTDNTELIEYMEERRRRRNNFIGRLVAIGIIGAIIFGVVHAAQENQNRIDGVNDHARSVLLGG